MALLSWDWNVIKGYFGDHLQEIQIYRLNLVSMFLGDFKMIISFDLDHSIWSSVT